MFDKNEYISAISDASEYIKSRCIEVPKICIVLGSGLSHLADICTIDEEIPYSDIPGFPLSTAPGHAGKLLIGTLSGKRVFMLSGRFHYYEGYEISKVVFYVRVMAKLGVKTLILTNAAGGILDEMTTPSFMIIEDHLSFFAESALRGPNLEEFGVRFPDQTHVYDQEYIKILEESASSIGIDILKGVYAYSKGPQYETPAEIRALKMLGAGAVGMSTVPEAITASHCGIRVAAFSCISNLAAGISSGLLSEEEVLENVNKVSENSCRLVQKFVSRIGGELI